MGTDVAGAPTSVQIRLATTPQDQLLARALILEYVGWVQARTGLDPLVEQPSLAADLDALDVQRPTPETAVYLAHDGQSAVGTITVHSNQDGSAELKRLYVRPIARRHGIADRLVDRALLHAATREGDRAWLETLPGAMDPAIALYRHHGFTTTETTARTTALDQIIVMERRLNPIQPQFDLSTTTQPNPPRSIERGSGSSSLPSRDPSGRARPRPRHPGRADVLDRDQRR